MSKFIQIDGRKIGEQYSPYIIAEMSANHNGSIENAIKLIELAKKSGADAVKMQTYRPDTITIDCDSEDFQIKGGLWDGLTLYKLYESAYTPWEWHKPLFEYARKLGITIFSSPFDNTAVDLLEDLNVPAYKIASFEAIDLPLIRYVAKTGKPMIISTGMANIEEINEAVETACQGGCKSLAILHCVSGYPALASEYNLKTIPDMISRFGLVTGLSDHTLDNTTAIASIALGASIVEKHFTLSRKGGGPDDSFSLEPQELAELSIGCKTAWSALGSINYAEKGSELGSIKHRRSLYFVKNLKSGDIITSENVKSIRPGMGLAPKYYDLVIGKKIIKDVDFGTPVAWNLLD
jgi:pseudaminic acid synthase